MNYFTTGKKLLTSFLSTDESHTTKSAPNTNLNLMTTLSSTKTN